MKHEMHEARPEAQEGGEEGGHGWLWMLLCCIPMIVIFVLIAVGVWSLR
jgi:hypothetical protein